MAYLLGFLAQSCAITALWLLGGETWVLVALGFHGFFSISAAAYFTAWLEDHERIAHADDLSEFFFATLSLMICLSIFMLVLLPLLWARGMGALRDYLMRD